MHVRYRRSLALLVVLSLAASLAVPPGAALAGGPSTAFAATNRPATKPLPAAAPTAAKASPFAAKSPVRADSIRSVVDATVLHESAGAGIVIDPLAPSIPGEFVVALDSPGMASTSERALRARGAKVDRVGDDPSSLLVKAPIGVSGPLFTELAKQAPGVARVQPNYLYRATYVPNDPRYTDQWGLSKIGAPAAWNTTKGRNTVVVAVVDTGADYTHPDLSGRIDTANDRDFVNGDLDAMDDNDHGTHVSGIIAATMDNHQGGTGVAPGVRILPVKVLDAKGTGTSFGVAAGIEYAADNGAKIINLSLAGPADPTMGDAVAYAQGKGCLVIAAAGNEGLSSGADYPARYYDVVGVGAVDSSLGRASFSNYGEGVDIAAPGATILSTVPGGTYESWSGTSMASPFVSGVAALVLGVNPTWSAAQIRAKVVGTAQHLTATGLGAGLVRADLAVAQGAVSPDDDIPGVTLPASPVSGTLDFLSDENDVYSVYLDAGQSLSASLNEAAPTGFELRLYASGSGTLAAGSVVVGSGRSPYRGAVTYTASTAGTYYLDIHAFDGAGAYQLTWTRTGQSDDDIPGVPIPASTVSGTLDSATDRFDVYSIDLASGQTLTAYLSGFDGADYDLWLYAPGSTGIDIDAPLVKRETSESDELLRYPVTASGRYSLVVYAYAGSGPYRLDWTSDPFTADYNIPGVPIPSSPVTDQIGGLGDMDDVYRVFLQAGQTIDCTLTALDPGTSPVLYLYDPTTTDNFWDTSVASAVTTDNPKAIEYTAESTGYYYVDVYSGGDQGGYRLEWSTTSTPDDNIPGVATSGPHLSGELGVATDTDDVYRIHADAGDLISASLAASEVDAASTDFDLYLYGPSALDTMVDQPLAKADGPVYPKAITLKAPVTGDYYLHAHAFAGEGSYAIDWTAKPFAHVYTPVAPSPVRRNVYFTVYGYLSPRHTSGYYLVDLRFYLKDSKGVYVYHHTVRARRYTYSSTKSKYKVSVRLPHSGKWRVHAVHADPVHATSYSGYDYITVR